MCSKDFKVLSRLFNKCGCTSQRRTTSSNCGLPLLLCLWLSFICVASYLTLTVSATSTYYDNNEMWVQGYLHYQGSSRGTPNNNLDDGQVHRIYLNAEAERTLAREPYLTNMSSSTAIGWIDSGYEVEIPYSSYLHIEQPHTYNTQTNYTATAYYEVEVVEIQTNLLYRPERNDRYITLLCAGGILILLVYVFKVVRHD